MSARGAGGADDEHVTALAAVGGVGRHDGMERLVREGGG